jgi:hypothetical protein
MEQINPYRDEQTHSNEEYTNILKAELESLDRRRAYIIDLLRGVDPETKAREDFIDECYEG